MKNPLLNILAALLLAVATSCSHGITKPVAQKSHAHVTSEEYNYFYLEALRLQNKGDHAAAFDLLSHCLEIDSLAAEVYYLLAPYYADMGQDSICSAFFKRAVELNPHNDAYHEMLAKTFIYAKDYPKAIAAYEELFAARKNRTDVLGILINLYQQQKNYDMMLNTLSRYEEQEGVSEQTVLSKMQVFTLKGDKDSAFGVLKSLADEHPNDANYKVMMGNWLMQNDRQAEARDIFLQAEHDEPNNEYVAASLYDFYRQSGEDSLSTVWRDRILMNKHTATSTKTTMLRTIITDNEDRGGDSTKVLSLFRQMMNSCPDDADVAEMRAAYMSMKGMPEDSIAQALQQVIEIAPDRGASRLQLLQLKFNNEEWDEAIALCLPALEYNAEDLIFGYYLGVLHFQKHDNEKALDAFRRARQRVTKDSDADIVSDIYAIEGDILHELGRESESFAAYDSCLQWKADNLGALNNYAYHLSVVGTDLKKAEAMSHKTVVAEPRNSTFLDTYAWILYMQERYTEAREYIDQTLASADSTQNNSTLYDHAGDIYAACDEPSRAIEYWQQAIDSGADNVAEIRKKMRKYQK